MQGDLYMVRNKINNKIYIGKTYIGYKNRWERHIADAYRFDTKFYRAIRKYGKDAFEINLISSFEEGELEQKEIEYIQLYDTYYNGYNSTLGGNGNTLININEKELLDLYKAGKSLNEIAKEFGTGTTRTISAILKRHGCEIKAQTAYYVNQYTKDWRFIQQFSSKQEAYIWLVNNYRHNMKRSEAYYYIKKSSEKDTIAFGYRWKQVDSHCVHKGHNGY